MDLRRGHVWRWKLDRYIQRRRKPRFTRELRPKVAEQRTREGRCWGDWMAQVLLVGGMHTSQDDAPKCWELYGEEYRVSIAPLALPR